MFDDIRDELKENWRYISAFGFVTLLAVIFALIVGFKSTEVQPIHSSEMGNGVICYTFNTGIDCLQVEK
jgi:hypothetical protein